MWTWVWTKKGRIPMSENVKTNPYQDTKVTLRRIGSDSWLMFTEDEGSIVASVTLESVSEKDAIERATTLASWFDAELVLEKVGAQ